MLLQTMEAATNSFWGDSLMFWLMWLVTFGLAAALIWFVYGKKYKDQVAAKETIIKKLNPQLNLLNNEKEHLAAEKATLKTNLAALVNKHNSLKSYHDSVQSKYLASTKQFEQANEERQSLLDSYESLEKNLESTEQQYNDALAKIDQLETELENMETSQVVSSPSLEQKEAISSELQALKRSISDKEVEINKLNLLLSAQPKIIEKQLDTSGLEQKNTTLQKDNEQLQSSYSALQLDYNKLRNAHTTLTNKFQALQGQQQPIAQTNIEESSLLENKLLLFEKKYQDINAQKEIIHSQLKQQEKVISDLQASNQVLHDKLETVSAQHQKALAHAKALQVSILSVEKNQAEKKGALNQVERMLKELQTENDRLKERNIELNIMHKQLTTQKDHLRKEVESLRPKANDSLTIAAKYQKEIQQLKLKIQSQEQDLLKSSSQKTVFTELKSTNLALDSKNKSLNTAYLNLQKKYDGFHKSHITLKSQFQLLRDKYEHLENTSNQVKEQKGKLEKLTANLTSEVDQLKQAQRALMLAKTTSDKRVKEIEKYLATPQKKSSTATTTKRYKNGKTTNSMPPDDLKVIEGISEKVEILLNNAGIFTWKQLSKTGIGELRRLLATNGNSLALNEPTTWPEQAELACANEWDQLEKFQKSLINGRRVT